MLSDATVVSSFEAYVVHITELRSVRMLGTHHIILHRGPIGFQTLHELLAATVEVAAAAAVCTMRKSEKVI